MARLSSRFAYPSACHLPVPQPRRTGPSVWAPALSLAATRAISFDFFSSAYLDVSVRRVPSTYLLIQYAVTMLHIVGFPHSDTCGSTLICSSPQLFAACRVLLRLPMPRHSPCALSSLNFMSFANRSNGFSCLLIVVFTLTLQYYLHCHVCTILDLLFLHFCFIQFSRYIVQSFRFAVKR